MLQFSAVFAQFNENWLQMNDNFLIKISDNKCIFIGSTGIENTIP